MTPPRAIDQTSRRPSALLLMIVHVEALLLDPGVYLQCVWWRIIGKRLRSRLALAPLLGRTKHAYDLWLSRSVEEQTVRELQSTEPIIALVQAGEASECTLTSLEVAQIKSILVDGSIEAILDRILEEHGEAWVLPLLSGDCVSACAGAIYRETARAVPHSTHVIYADDDLVDDRHRRHSPHFKPDWNSELFRHFDYLTGSAIVRLRTASDAETEHTDWAAKLVANAVDRTASAKGEVKHIDEILHHRRTRPKPLVPAEPLPTSNDPPDISVIIPTRNRHDLLSKCLEGLTRTRYPKPLEIVVIDNGSDDPATRDYLQSLDPQFARILSDDSPFNFATLNNNAVMQTEGDLLCFLNNDIEITNACWLETMACQAVRNEVGAVGAQLLYPDGRIQHAGVVTGIGGAAAHAHRLLDPDEEGYFHRHKLPQFVTAVTAACMVLDREKFNAVGGFDAQRFAVSFNDVDLCLRLREHGWQSLYEPRAQLVHHESVSRGFDRDPAGAARQKNEVAALQKRWDTQLALEQSSGHGRSPDPYHHKQLSRLSEHFVVDL